MMKIAAKIGTHSTEVVFARVKRKAKGDRAGRAFICGDWLQVKRLFHGAKWEGPLHLDEVRLSAGGTFTCDGLHVMHWI